MSDVKPDAPVADRAAVSYTYEGPSMEEAVAELNEKKEQFRAMGGPE